MDPISLALMGVSGISSIMGGMAANDANKTNNRIALLNYYEQQEANRRSRMEAQRQQQEAKLGSTDAAGNRTYFVPGRGWVTELSDDQQQLQDLSETATERQLTQGEARDEQVQQRAASRRGREDTQATEAEREFRSARRGDEGALRQLLLARGAEGRNRQADRAGDASARQAVRSGQGGSAADIRQGARAEADADSARQASIDAALGATQMADQQFTQDRDAPLGVYDYFRKMSTSGTTPAQPYMPTGPQTRSTGVADQGAINAMARTAQQDYQAPNDAWARTVGDVGAAVGGYQNSQLQKQYMDMYADQFGKRQTDSKGMF